MSGQGFPADNEAGRVFEEQEEGASAGGLCDPPSDVVVVLSDNSTEDDRADGPFSGEPSQHLAMTTNLLQHDDIPPWSTQEEEASDNHLVQQDDKADIPVFRETSDHALKLQLLEQVEARWSARKEVAQGNNGHALKVRLLEKTECNSSCVTPEDVALNLIQENKDADEPFRDDLALNDEGNVRPNVLSYLESDHQPGFFPVLPPTSTPDYEEEQKDGEESTTLQPAEESQEQVAEAYPVWGDIPEAEILNGVIIIRAEEQARLAAQARLGEQVALEEQTMPEEQVRLEEKARLGEQANVRRRVIAVFLLSVAAVILGLVLGLPRAKTPSRPMLEVIHEAGILRCGVWASLRDLSSLTGVPSQVKLMDELVCRALAAALLGDPDKSDVVVANDAENLKALVNGSLHILTGHAHTDMQTDVYRPELQTGFSFSLPFLYTDYMFLGSDLYVACAEDDMNTFGDCEGIRICTNSAHSFFSDIVHRIPEKYLIIKETDLEVLQGFLNDECDVIIDPALFRWILNSIGYKGDYVVGTKRFEAMSGTVAIRDGDPHFIDIVNVVLLGLMFGEQHGITQSRASDIGEIHLLGDQYKDMLIRAVSATGNYQEVFDNGAEPVIARNDTRWNCLNNGTTGLMRSTFLGPVMKDGPGPISGGTLESISKRRKLRCGVRLNRPGFVNDTMQGLDVDFCKAVTASLFTGDVNALEWVKVVNASDGYRKLNSGEVDLLAGYEWTIQDDVREVTTGKGYSFSQPYFYRPLNNSAGLWDENLCLTTRQDDEQFTSFVNWIVVATIFAEEHDISQRLYNEMPDVNLFGPDFTRMFRDTIYSVGNYQEIYARNLEVLLPRSGRNMLNSGDNLGPQLYVPPGFSTYLLAS